MCLTAGALFVSCSKEPSAPPAPGPRGALRFEAAPQEGWNSGVKTRAMPVTTGTFHSSFGVYAASYSSSDGWNPETDFDFMKDVKVSRVNGSGSIYATEEPYYLPGAGKSLRFFAYAPYDAADLTSSDPGVLEFIFYTADDVADQTDFCVARSADVAGDGDGTVHLDFQHTLVGVRFVTGTVPTGGRLRSLTLRHIRTGAILEVPKDGEKPVSWTKWVAGPSIGSWKDLVLPLDVQLSGEAGQAVTGDSETFLLIPDPTGESSVVELLYDPDGVEGSGDERTLTAPIGDKGELDDANMGKIVTYRVSIAQDELKLSATIEDWTSGGEVDADASTTPKAG